MREEADSEVYSSEECPDRTPVNTGISYFHTIPMQVTARYITMHRSKVEMFEEAIDLWEGATVKDLRKAMLKRNPDLDLRDEHTKAAMGQGFVRPDTLLLDGDVVTFNPATREERI
jgi:molybdopterin converting factor small subunit